MHRSHGMLTIDHQKHAQLDVVHIHTSSLIELHDVVAGVASADVRLVDRYVLGQLGASSAVYLTMMSPFSS